MSSGADKPFHQEGVESDGRKCERLRLTLTVTCPIGLSGCDEGRLRIMFVARWQIDARFGHKQKVIDMLLAWEKISGSRQG
jgi:hypothetical protein